MSSVAAKTSEGEAFEEVKTLEGEAYEAAKKFEDEFNYRKMDKMIHRFPPGLSEIIISRSPYMVVPRSVAIGPYHHGKKHLEKMEAVKKAAARFLWQRSRKLQVAVKTAAAYFLWQRSDEKPKKPQPNLDSATREVVNAVNEARGLYFADETVTGEEEEEKEEEGMMKDDAAQFEDMMICDASFLLLYMDAYNRSYGEHDDGDDVNESMRRFLFCNRYRINNDIMLLENQLPWRVILALMRLDSDLKLKEAVGYFIAAMGSSFKILESSNLELYRWWEVEPDKLPPHLLALLRRHKTEEPDKIHHSASAVVGDLSDDDVENNSNNHLPPPFNSVDQPLIQQPPPPSTQAGNLHEVLISAISPMDLEQIGIKLTADPTAGFSGMGLEKGWLRSRLKLAPLSLGDTGASWLVNMAAFEVCTASRFGDPPCRTAVCSYLALLAFFMVGSGDVRKLRSMGLLHGPISDDDMLAFFETLKKHLPDYGTHFADVMADIEDYKQKTPIRTTLYRWVYNNWKTIGAVVSIIVAAVTAIAALIRLYQELLSLIHNN